MVRTQIQLTEEQQAALRAMSAATGRSIAQLIREAVDQTVSRANTRDRDEKIARAMRAAGKFGSGHRDVSSRHDEHLAEIYK
jgi:predicted DNA-binding protein